MKLSVIIVSYKFKDYIKQAIDSVLNQQTNFDFELLIRDDFSNDGTEEVIVETLKLNTNNKVTIRHFLSTENWGAFNNIKFLLENCKGEYVSYLDGDDFFSYMSKLQHQVDFLDNNPEYVVHSTGSYLLDKYGNDLIGDGKYLVPLKEDVVIEDVFGANIVTFGKTFRNLPNLIQSWMENVIFLDWIIVYNLLKNGKAKCEDWPSGCYRTTGDGSMTSLSTDEINKESDYIRELLKKDYTTFMENKNKFWNLPNQTNAFNGDKFVEDEFIKLKENHNIVNAVETGSYMFGTTMWFSENFNHVYTFEISDEFYQYGKELIRDKQNISAFHSDSVMGLNKIIRSIKGNTIFFLDAHWYDYCPLLDELESISKFNYTPVIVIHDFKTPHKHLGYDFHNEQPFSIDFISDKLNKIYPLGYDYYYNNETVGGASRGVIYITPKSKKKQLVIIDSFLSNSQIEEKTFNQIDLFRSNGYDVLLTSNTIPSKKTINICDYFLFDSKNQLFNSNYDNVEVVDFFNSVGDFTVHNLRYGLQRHGLSVLINFHHAVNYAKSLGYTNFLRVESDDLFGVESFKFIKQSEKLLEENSKKALLFYNENQSRKNLSFHFLYFNIDYFLDKIIQLKNEQDYKNYLSNNFGNSDFQIAEEFLYNCLKLNGDDEVLIYDGQKFSTYFPDTIWNTTSSLSNIETNYEDAITSIYKIKNNEESLFIFSMNYSDKSLSRKIKINFDDRQEELIHDLPTNGSWAYQFFDNKLKSIEVYDNISDVFLYEEKNQNISNYVEFN